MDWHLYMQARDAVAQATVLNNQLSRMITREWLDAPTQHGLSLHPEGATTNLREDLGA